jgi:hypothetical protein
VAPAPRRYRLCCSCLAAAGDFCAICCRPLPLDSRSPRSFSAFWEPALPLESLAAANALFISANSASSFRFCCTVGRSVVTRFFPSHYRQLLLTSCVRHSPIAK